VKAKARKSHDEAMVQELRERPEFADAYLKAALEDAEEPGVRSRRVAQALGSMATFGAFASRTAGPSPR